MVNVADSEPEWIFLLLNEFPRQLEASGLRLSVESYSMLCKFILIKSDQGCIPKYPDSMGNQIGLIFCKSVSDKIVFDREFYLFCEKFRRSEKEEWGDVGVYSSEKIEASLVNKDYVLDVKVDHGRSRGLFISISVIFFVLFFVFIYLCIDADFLDSFGNKGVDIDVVGGGSFKYPGFATYIIFLPLFFFIISGYVFIAFKFRNESFGNAENIAQFRLKKEVFENLSAAALAINCQRDCGVEVDWEATAEATSKEAGFFSPKYKLNSIKSSEVIFLVEKNGANDQLGDFYCDYICLLIQEGVSAEVYFYNGDVRFLQRGVVANSCICAEASLVSLCSLVVADAEQCLIVFGTGRGFYRVSDGVIPNDLKKTFKKISRKLFLTPVPFPDWSSFETCLELIGFSVLPSDVGSFSRVEEWIVSGSVIHVPDEMSWRGYPELILRDPDLWMHDSVPSDGELVVRQLECYLGSGGLILISIFGVYPIYNWGKTKYIAYNFYLDFGRIYFSSESEFFNCLCRILALPWFRNGYMPEWIRGLLAYNLNLQSAVLKNAARKYFSNLNSLSSRQFQVWEEFLLLKNALLLRIPLLRVLKLSPFSWEESTLLFDRVYLHYYFCVEVLPRYYFPRVGFLERVFRVLRAPSRLLSFFLESGCRYCSYYIICLVGLILWFVYYDVGVVKHLSPGLPFEQLVKIVGWVFLAIVLIGYVVLPYWSGRFKGFHPMSVLSKRSGGRMLHIRRRRRR